MKSTRAFLRGAVFLATLAAIDIFAFCVLSAARDRATAAVQDADICQRLADRIVALRSRPAIAGSAALPQENLSRRVETAVRNAGIAADSLASIEPDPPARIGDTSYLEKPTTIQLRNVALPEIANVLCELTKDGSGLRVKSLRLTIPPQEQNGNLWSAEFTLAYLIYSPLPAPKQIAQRS